MDSKYVSTKSTSLVLVFVGMIFCAVIGFTSYYIINALVYPPMVGFEIDFSEATTEFPVGHADTERNITNGLRVYAIYQDGKRVQKPLLNVEDPNALDGFEVDLEKFYAAVGSPGFTEIIIRYRDYLPKTYTVEIVLP